MPVFLYLSNYRATTLICILLLSLLSTIQNTANALDNLGSKITITKSGLVLNRITKTFDGTITITNISTETITAPLTITVKNITSPNVAVYNTE